MKEAKERYESIEEELTDAHRLMGERGRESETMRRLLAEVEGRSEVRVKDMRERMELAIQERDRAEEDASSVGRRRAREIEDLKSKLRDIERDAKRFADDREDLERAERDLRRQRDDDHRRVEEATQELAELRKAMSEIRDALDESERQVREYEIEIVEQKRAAEESQQSRDKLQKTNKTLADELRNARATRIRPTDSPAQSTRSSNESARRDKVHTPSSPRPGSAAGSGTAGVDYVYLKNVLLQFMEQKDKGHQMQLVPVLSMLLHFDK